MNVAPTSNAPPVFITQLSSPETTNITAHSIDVIVKDKWPLVMVGFSGKGYAD
ncbi:hypothetical protein [Glaciimonas sp. PCH181]|uniref:hypothetical protein n=1 Tax=Glaciimonas sp. PCH181 TaxID=2133943 RepID=UPI00137512B0|nr:hypothetical protein [Glaciimonas sp. PCH181]